MTHLNGPLFGNLLHFGFGTSLLNWIKVFYCDIESCILNNGWPSNFFKLSRGVRQGCPLSPYLFILSVEILADAIRQKKEIRGITLNGKEIKLSQYADDTTFILDGSENSFLEALKMIELFGKKSSLKLNNRKQKPCGQVPMLKAILNFVLKRTLNGLEERSKP